MLEANETETQTMKVSDCAREMRVSDGSVIEWIKKGHLIAFLPPGADPQKKQRGPKGYRILREDWDRFVAAQRFTGQAEPAPLPHPSRPPALNPTGTDGVKRRGRRTTV